MARVEGAIEVERPLAAVYEHLLGQPGVSIVERVPDEAVAWTPAEDGSESWRASLIALSPKRTRVDLAVDHDPSGLVERAADAFGALQRRLDDDLARLKDGVESSTPRPD
jgi:hypothetical protein